MRPYFVIVALTALGLATPAAAMEASASYVITLGGINIASADITLTDDGSRYGIDLDADVIGLGNLVAKGRAIATTAGTVDGDRLQPQTFSLETVTNGERFVVSVEYSGTEATGFVVDPPMIFDYGRIPIERAHLRGVTDMMTAFVIKGGALDATLCDRSTGVFTGPRALRHRDAVPAGRHRDLAAHRLPGTGDPLRHPLHPGLGALPGVGDHARISPKATAS